jgi:hypothetical protein
MAGDRRFDNAFVEVKEIYIVSILLSFIEQTEFYAVYEHICTLQAIYIS